MLTDKTDQAIGDRERLERIEHNATGRPDLEQRLEANWPASEWSESHVVLAVSGGADSVAMLRAMAAIKTANGGPGRVYVAHLNHGLRGDEADADAVWLEILCEQMGLPFEMAKVDVASLAARQGDGHEAAARTARYEFLRQTAERLGARFVATAHTADDQVETVLQRILRGTGLQGLTGIPEVRPLSKSVALVRPLLTVWRRDVIGYLAALGQDYRTDSSNDDERMTRNRLRHELLPLLRERFNAEVDAALLRMASQADEAQQVVENLATGIARECVAIEFRQGTVTDDDRAADGPARESRRASRIQIDCRRLAGEPAIIIREVCKLGWTDANWPLQSMGFYEWQQLARLVSAADESPVANLPENIRACRDRHLLVLE